MAKPKFISVKKGINNVTKDINIELFKARTVKNVVVNAEYVPDDIDFDNPDPTQPFLGKDGKWYRIEFPNGFFNCYLFAMGWFTSVPNSAYGIPGFLVGRIPRTVKEFKKLIIKDLKAVNRKVYEIYEGDEIPEILPPAKPNTYWVKVYFANGEDIGSFHISRKDETSGRWLHKMGWEAPFKVVCDNFEFGDSLELLAQRHKEVRQLLEMYPIDFIRSFAASRNVFTLGVTKSKWQDLDNAEYRAFSPDEIPDDFTIYKPKWVMRVDD